MKFDVEQVSENSREKAVPVVFEVAGRGGWGKLSKGPLVSRLVAG